MSLYPIIKVMVEAGCTPEQIAAVVRHHEVTLAEKILGRRAKDAARKRRSRIQEVTTETTDVRVTATDNQDELPPPKERSPTPPKEITPSLPSLRSGDRSREELFDQLRKVYPKRAGADPPKPAREKFQLVLRRGVDPETIIAGAAAYARHEARKGEPQFTKTLAVWLNQECWTEDWDGKPSARAGPVKRPPTAKTSMFNEVFGISDDEPSFDLDLQAIPIDDPYPRR